MIQGNFIVLEGIDGSGTSTQANRIKGKFAKLNLPAHVTAEPSSGPIGSTIRQILQGRIVTRLPHGVSPPNWITMSLLFAADRADHVESEIVPNLRDGVNVICDRYVYSSVIYQSASTDDKQVEEWITQINHHIKKPDLVLNLQVSPEVAIQRCQDRDKGIEIYDDSAFQQKLAKAYEKLGALFPDVNIVTIDGEQSVEEVTDACWSQVEQLRSAGAPI